jgi:hypothetical protein
MIQINFMNESNKRNHYYFSETLIERNFRKDSNYHTEHLVHKILNKF